jgi:hypothetical protein
VQFGKLTKPLQKCDAPAGTTLGEFCRRKEIAFGASIRVNNEAKRESYVLQNQDIITDIDNVSGGFVVTVE